MKAVTLPWNNISLQEQDTNNNQDNQGENYTC